MLPLHTFSGFPQLHIRNQHFPEWKGLEHLLRDLNLRLAKGSARWKELTELSIKAPVEKAFPSIGTQEMLTGRRRRHLGLAVRTLSRPQVQVDAEH